MTYSLEKGNVSNYSISIPVDEAMQTAGKSSVLKQFQKEFTMQGFRKGHVPLSIVEKQVQPEYMKMSIYEQIITKTLKKIVEEKKDIRFIGSPYDINFDDKEGQTTISLKLDVYPEIEVANDDWKKVTLTAIDVAISDEERNTTVETFKRQYADYVDTDGIEDDTVTKVNYVWEGNDGEEIGKSVMYVGNEEAAQFPELKTLFWGKKKEEVFSLDYDEKALPAVVHYTKEGDKPSRITFTVGDVKKIVLPTFDESNIKKYFGEEAKVTTEAEVIEMITESMKEEKFNKELMGQVESKIQELMTGSLKVVIPQTMIDEEKNQRLKNMKERFGGEEAYKKYLAQLGEDKQKAMVADISKAAKESLEKFLVFRQWIELLQLDVSWEKQLDPEYAVYKSHTGGEVYKSAFLDEISKR